MIKQLFIEVEESSYVPGGKPHRHLLNPRAIDRIEECFRIDGEPRTYIVMNDGSKILVDLPYSVIVNKIWQVERTEEES